MGGPHNSNRKKSPVEAEEENVCCSKLCLLSRFNNCKLRLSICLSPHILRYC